MKKAFVFFVFFLTPLMALEFEVKWNYRFEKEILITCLEDEYYCMDLCDEQPRCVLKEKICRDCIGSTPYLTHVFNQIGRSIVRSEEALVEDLIEFLKTGRFTFITQHSVFNHVDRFNGPEVREKFFRLCQGISENSVMVFELAEVSKNLGRPKFLICDNQVFYLDANGGVVVREE